MVRYGIIGAGRLGNVHAASIAALENAQLGWVYDIDGEAASKMSLKYGAEICSSADELARRADAVIVSSPSDCHYEGIAAAVRAGKCVFTEKPLCRTGHEADMLKELLTGYAPVFGVGFVRRHMNKTLRMKEMLDSGKIGRVRFCNVDLPFGAYKRMYGDWFTDYRRSGGVILDMLAHHIDLANWFFGRPKRVFAQGLLLDASQKLPADYVSATVTYANGVIVNFMCSWQRFGRSNERMEIYGEEGALTMGSGNSLEWVGLNGESGNLAAEEKAGSPGVSNASTGNGFLAELTAFTDAVEKHQVFSPGLSEALSCYEVAQAMMKSAEENVMVELS